MEGSQILGLLEMDKKLGRSVRPVVGPLLASVILSTLPDVAVQFSEALFTAGAVKC
jgi:hypothetical protein